MTTFQEFLREKNLKRSYTRTLFPWKREQTRRAHTQGPICMHHLRILFCSVVSLGMVFKGLNLICSNCLSYNLVNNEGGTAN